MDNAGKQHMNVCFFNDKDILEKNITLDENSIHIWLLDIHKYNEIRSNTLLALLSLEEKNKLSKYIHKDDKKSFLLGHSLLRVLLSRYMQRNPMDINFSVNEHGKLYIRQSDVSFNISHSGNYVVLSFVKGKSIGIDIEKMNILNEYAQIAQNFFLPCEYEQICSGGNDEKNMRIFYKIWTIKEAYVKAFGVGLSRSLKSFEILNDGSIKDYLSNSNYLYYSNEIQGNYVCSVVVV